ncbi:TetR/AcrR family transcriptional regulator [Paenibacillus glufosinatiresistens]|uniref:TetR/AcrR family transcriptional regulator n=1 Tax=Paenibacillus glufosinatiresistens TaxID=3070657 RepID=UPI00286E2402|nr:TetR/AcrR family transcriptional regulator [Paenibacillus sp. YX.27]
MSGGSNEREGKSDRPDKQRAILDAAFSLFGSKGFYETRIAEVAELAGIAKGTVYLYFRNKEELFLAVSRRDCEQFMTQLAARLKREETPAGKLAAIAEHHLLYYYERKQHTKLFFRAPTNHPELMAFMQQFMEAYTNLVQQVLLDADAAEAQLLSQAYIGMLDRLKMDILFDPAFTEADARHRIAFAADLFLRGAESGKYKH